MRKLFLVLIPFLWVGTVQAKATDADFQLRTAQNLYNLCSVSNSNAMRERAVYLCVGYIEGALDLYQTLVRIGRLVPRSCMPLSATRIEIARAFIAWGKANPGKLKQATMDGLGEAVQTRWPCRK